MRIDIFTLFPALFTGVFDESIVKRASEVGLVDIHLHNIRDYAHDRHHVTDDEPYGGGGGMVMKAEPIFRAVESVLSGQKPPADSARVVLLSPAGCLFSQAVARDWASCAQLLLICGRYEGVDERVRQYLVTDEVSVGDYVLSGGEIPAMVVVETVTRLLPGALGDPLAPAKDSHAEGLLEHPHYTRPAIFRGWTVPDVLLSGNHGAIAKWRRQQALLRTYRRRPDLLATAKLSVLDRQFLDGLSAELDGTQGDQHA